MSIYPAALIAGISVWSITLPEQAGEILQKVCDFILGNFSAWYIWLLSGFVIVGLLLAAWPATGRIRLGAQGDKPEFSYFSWLSMIFGAGMGIGMLTWAVAEPLYLLNNNPDVIQGIALAGHKSNIINAYKWTFFHWGISAWSTYAICGLSIAYFSYRRGQPFTFQSALSPLVGAKLSKPMGAAVGVIAVVATVLGIAHTLSVGVKQIASSAQHVGLTSGLVNSFGSDLGIASEAASPMAKVIAILIIAALSILSAVSGVHKGVKWFANINMSLSLLLLLLFLLAGPTWAEIDMLFTCIVDYIKALPQLLFTVWKPDGTSVGNELADWQGKWTIFHLAWWIVFAPFVGLFLARISRGRSIREFIVGAMIAPAFMCFLWFTWAGGTAIDMEMTGTALGAINAASDVSKIFVMTNLLLKPTVSAIVAISMIVLLATYLITSFNAALLMITTIVSNGSDNTNQGRRIIVWGCAISLMAAAFVLVGGLSAIQTAMVVFAAPFSFALLLMCIALLKAIYTDRTTNLLPAPLHSI